MNSAVPPLFLPKQTLKPADNGAVPCKTTVIPPARWEAKGSINPGKPLTAKGDSL